MKHNVLTLSLFRKKRWERASFRTDPVGVLFRALTAVLFAAAFFLFFGKFLGLYLSIGTDGAPDEEGRLFELVVVCYALLILSFALSAAGTLLRRLFLSDDLKLLFALPVPPRSLLLSEFLSVCLGQELLSAGASALLSAAFSLEISLPPSFYVLLFGAGALIPPVALVLGALLALPFYLAVLFLRGRHVLSFLLVTALTAGGVVLYARLLGAVKELLLGDELKYFFDEGVMRAIAAAVSRLYPANALAKLVFGRADRGILLLAALFLAALPAAFFLVRVTLRRAVRSSPPRSVLSRGSAPPHSPFFALVKKEFFTVFRTPSYMFSYLSVAVVMPVFVYFCMSLGSSLIRRLLGLDCTAELALFLTLLFGALTNVFCSTNVSREGGMFYSVKALPLPPSTVFGAKIAFCMLVGGLSQLLSALILVFSGYMGAGEGAALFAVGVLFSLAQVCFATRYDFAHARFPAADGEAEETSSTAGVIVLLGLFAAFLLGGGALGVRLFLSLRGTPGNAALTYLCVFLLSLLFAALSCAYLFFRLPKKYNEFHEGGLK